ncbi:hypothetical protein [Bacillus alkalicellulosilyticus]|uniref:hypothetical protein n=1 Tax=Alkalihalobacterium alkalicellulosilyticum TaxID=1912214 RepID=UPI000997DAA8|nr:hypothetical protein [Bacillus alkalicellulosilyticus]
MLLQQTQGFRKQFEMRVDDEVLLLNDIQHGEITLPRYTRGTIVSLYNQFKAMIWFDNVLENGSVSLEGNQLLNGLALELDREHFAIAYVPKAFVHAIISEEKAKFIPYFSDDPNKKVELNIRRLSKNGSENLSGYYFEDLLQIISFNFKQWAMHHLADNRISQPYHSNSVIQFLDNKQELEWIFATVTGVYYEFYQNYELNIRGETINE